jgi:AcrR family transcriptional regulator
MTKNLQSRKRQLVQDAIYDAAVNLFAKKGFDQTTVEEVAEAAGISRRSFFRYFESKDDLLALNTVLCGEVLIETVASCPAGFDILETVRQTVFAGVKFTEAQKHTNQIITIAERSTSARQAHLSRWMEVQDKLALAYAARVKSRPFDLRPNLYAGISLLIINCATASWFKEEHKDVSTAAKQAFLHLGRLLGDPSDGSSEIQPVTGGKRLSSTAQKKSRSPKLRR